MKIYVRIGSDVGPFFGQYNVSSITELKSVVKAEIENLSPLNSSEKGREEYKLRFRDKPLFIKQFSEKDYKHIDEYND